MSFYSGFFNAKNNDRVYSAGDFTSYLSCLICDGIMDTYGDSFKYTADGLNLKLGSGKAWIDGHYFVSDTEYVFDLSKYVDASLPKYVAIGIVLDKAQRTVGFEVTAGTAASSPSVPAISSGSTRKVLTLYAAKLTAGAVSISDVKDYRSDTAKCGYCRCILGKCKVSEILDALSAYNSTIANLTNQVAAMQKRLDEIEEVTGATGVVLVSAGKCGDSAFYSLYSDGRLNITGNGTTYSYEKSSDGLFYKNLTIKKVNISSGITSIGSYLFYGCSNLESAELPVTITSIGERAFDSTGIKSVTIPSNVKTIGSYAFTACHSLSAAVVNSSVMGSYMFTSCGSLKKLTISKNTTTFGSNMLTYCGVTEIIYLGTIDEWKAITKPNNWICSADGYHNGTLQKITMTNGYMEYRNGSWYTYKN